MGFILKKERNVGVVRGILTPLAVCGITPGDVRLIPYSYS